MSAVQRSFDFSDLAAADASARAASGREVQLSFEGINWDQPRDPDPSTTTRSIREAFEAFNAKNPHVYVAIVTVSRQLRRAGFQRLGMKALFERLRWEYAMRTRGETWKLNNNFTSEYARLVMQREPDLDGLFETRSLIRREHDA